MKPIILTTLLVAVISMGLSAETEPTNDTLPLLKKWELKSSVALNINQLHLSNWAEGGESSMSGTMWFNFMANHKKEKYSANHQLIAGYGVLTNRDRDLRKTEDRLDYTGTFDYQKYKYWSYTALVNFRTQFSNGYRYPNDSVIISTFMAPAYITLSLGMQLKPSDKFSLFLSPASGKFTVVANQELADKGSFGVTPATYIGDSLVAHGNWIKPEFGMSLNANLKKEISTHVNLESRFILHNNYLDSDPSNRWNFDINWDALLSFTVNKTINTTLRMNLIYDHNIKINDYKMIDGEKVLVGSGPRMQFKESFGIGINYKF
ncbi:MAG: DUF3078 domain-containing protein [Bacteroidales bacterium]